MSGMMTMLFHRAVEADTAPKHARLVLQGRDGRAVAQIIEGEGAAKLPRSAEDAARTLGAKGEGRRWGGGGLNAGVQSWSLMCCWWIPFAAAATGAGELHKAISTVLEELWWSVVQVCTPCPSCSALSSRPLLLFSSLSVMFSPADLYLLVFPLPLLLPCLVPCQSRAACVAGRHPGRGCC